MEYQEIYSSVRELLLHICPFTLQKLQEMKTVVFPGHCKELEMELE